jgi:hypothetical protein
MSLLFTHFPVHFYGFKFKNIFSILRSINPEQSRLIAEQLLDAFTQRIGPLIMRTVDIKFAFIYTKKPRKN